MKRAAALHGALAGTLVTIVVLGALVAFAACGGASEAGPGGECFVATDCAVGLVCVEQANKTRVCSSDLARVAGKTPPEGGTGDGGEDEGGEAPDGAPPTDADRPDVVTQPPDSGADTGPADTGVKDTGADVTPPT